MNILLLCVAVLFLAAGHFFKSLRWKQFISVHEDIKLFQIVKTLSIGYTVDFLIPLHIGDIIKGIYLGKKSKNGFAYIISTIIIDRFFDVAAVTLISAGICLYGTDNIFIRSSLTTFVVLMSALILLSIVAFLFTKEIKKIVLGVAGIFNTKIEFNILLFTWSGITCFKDVMKSMSKVKLIVNTVMMWTMYLLSYYLFSLFLTDNGFETDMADVFASFFAQGSFYKPTITEVINSDMPYMMAVFITVPLIILFITAVLDSLGKEKSETESSVHLLPQIEQRDRHIFLQEYFKGNNRNFLKNYINMSENITIIKDCSAGSNAATVLCMSDNRMLFRKYAYGDESKKLGIQYNWLRKHRDELNVAEAFNLVKKTDYLCYDMPYQKNYDSFFNFIHNRDISNSKTILTELLRSLNCFHRNHSLDFDEKPLEEYIKSKVYGNIEKIYSCKEIESLIKHKKLIINGKEYLNLEQLMEYLSSDKLKEIFSSDNKCVIHGDLTIENIIAGDEGYYFIDPNETGYSVSFLDYAKLLQSLHGNYEFFMMTSPVSAEGNRISIKLMKSSQYEKMYEFYHNFLTDTFTEDELKSIYYHEIIHWLRLMPYKIANDAERVLNFYCGLIIVMNEVIIDEVYKRKEIQSSTV